VEDLGAKYPRLVESKMPEQKKVYKIFCDESCHLEHDSSDIMVVGALHCSAEKAVQLSKQIKLLRHQFNYKPELKWSRLNKNQWLFYKALIDMFVADTELSFKATVVLHKERLNHELYNAGSHNTFYYKMFYYTLRDFLKINNEYRVYLDYMDTLGADKTKKLCEILTTSIGWDLEISATIVQSHESQIIQLCDLLIGAVGYKNRSDINKISAIKNQFVSYLEEQLDKPLCVQTPPWEEKFNIFRFPLRGSEC